MEETIEYLDWDSDFFGLKIGKCIYSKVIDNIDLNTKGFDLIYLFSQIRLSNYINELKDEKCLLNCSLENANVRSNIINPNIVIESFDRDIHSYNKLLSLVYESGAKSRFKIDDKFAENSFKDLYKKWLDNSLNGNLAIDTLVALYDNEIVGFLTYGSKDDITADITLTAVDSSIRGQKVATTLIERFKYIVKEKGYKFASVVTQFTNEPALNLYQKNFFKIKNITYIYHIWNNDTI